MDDTWRSIPVGTAGLSLAAVAALVLTLRRRAGSAVRVTDARIPAWFAGGIAAQFAHFSEEFITGFHLRFPLLFGLAPWPPRFFVNFNLACIAVWLFSVPLVRRNFRPAFLPAWFFALAAIAGGVVHPLLALRAGGYFPGLWTSPLVGGLGLLLWLRLWRATAPAAMPEG